MWAPTTSSAGLSEASTQPWGSLPRQSGRKPWGSRTPTTWFSSMATTEKAPLRRGSTASTARSSARPSSLVSGFLPSSAAIISVITSLSEVMVPGSMPSSSARSSVLTRLPL